MLTLSAGGVLFMFSEKNDTLKTSVFKFVWYAAQENPLSNYQKKPIRRDQLEP